MNQIDPLKNKIYSIICNFLFVRFKYYILFKEEMCVLRHTISNCGRRNRMILCSYLVPMIRYYISFKFGVRDIFSLLFVLMFFYVK